jgi:hypothetical protein
MMLWDWVDDNVVSVPLTEDDLIDWPSEPEWDEFDFERDRDPGDEDDRV